MATQYDLTPVLAKNLDPHLALPLIEFLQARMLPRPCCDFCCKMSSELPSFAPESGEEPWKWTVGVSGGGVRASFPGRSKRPLARLLRL